MTTPLYFPIAGAAGSPDPNAAPYDRRWLVVDEGGAWVTREHCPQLENLLTEIRFGYLVMRGEGMLRMDLPLDVIEDDDSVRRSAVIGRQTVDVVDEGNLAAAWVAQFLQRPYRLVKVHPDAGPVIWPDL